MDSYLAFPDIDESKYCFREIIIISVNQRISPLSENQTTEPAGACGLGPVWYQGIGIHHGGRWQPVPKQFTSPKITVMLVKEN